MLLLFCYEIPIPKIKIFQKYINFMLDIFLFYKYN